MPTDHTLKPKQDAHPFLTAFQIVKDTLSCKKHPGENTWCWVDPAADSEHIPLCSHDIQLWAKYSLLHPAAAACTTLPDMAHFTNLLKTRKSRHVAPLSRTSTELIEDSPKSDEPKSSGLSRQYAVYLEFDETHAALRVATTPRMSLTYCTSDIQP